MAEEDFGENPNDEESINQEKKINEPKKSKSDFINIDSSKQFLDSLSYAALKLEKSVEDLKSFNELGKIKEHVLDLKNIKIDTSSFEKQFSQVLDELKNKIEETKDKVDLNELDEINDKFTSINKKIKPMRYFGFFIISIFAFSAGWLGNIVYSESVNITKSEADILAEFKMKKIIQIGENKNVKYILIPNGKSLVNSGKNKAIILEKEGK